MTTEPPLKVNGRIVEAGTEISVHGETGRFTVRYLYPGDGSVACYGGRPGHEMWRAFTLTRIRTVHSKPKIRANVENA